MTEYIEKFWRPATDRDVVDVMNDKKVEARFRDKESQRWQSGFSLGGWMKCKAHPWLDGDASTWTHCQVYAPPQWYVDKPDPGEEFRLLGKFPDEPVQGGDFFKNTSGWVQLRDGCVPTQAEGVWYRRKIEQPKPEPKHYVLQVGDTVETPSGHLIKIVDRPTEQMQYTLQVGDTISTPSGRQAIVTEHGVEVS